MSEDIRSRSRAVTRFAQAISAGLVVLGVEYFGDLTGKVTALGLPPEKIVFLILILTGSAVALICALQSMIILIRCDSYFREDFALAAGKCLIALFLLTTLASLASMTPWSVLGVFSLLVGEGGRATLVDAPKVDIILLGVVTICVYLFTAQRHFSWGGQKSADQAVEEADGENPSILKDFKSELRRRIKNAPPRSRAPLSDVPVNASEVVATPSNIRSWKNQALEIARILDWVAHEPEATWLESEQIWVGEDRMTCEGVVIHPCDTSAGDAAVNRLVDVAIKLRRRKKRQISRIVIFCRTKCETLNRTVGGTKVERKSVDDLLGEIPYGTYLTSIDSRCQAGHAFDATVPLEKSYVPLEINRQDGGTEKLDVHVDEWLGRDTDCHLVILGDYGQGKSTFALLWTKKLIEKLRRKELNRIPILMELRGKSPRNLQEDELFGAWAAHFGLNGRLFAILHELGKTVLVLDAFDEMALVGSSHARLEHFRALWMNAHPGSKMLITGRPNLFFDSEELNRALNVRTVAGLGIPYTEIVRLKSFSNKQIGAFLSGYDHKTKKEILKAVERNESFRELISRPSLLCLAAGLWKKEGLSAKVDTLTSATILELFISNSLSRQADKQRKSPKFMVLGPSEREFFMEGVAAWLLTREQQNQISGQNLRGCVECLLQAIPDALARAEIVGGSEDSAPLRVRLRERKDAIDIVLDDVKTCGLLISDPILDGAFKFGHKSFFDFLVAKVAFKAIFDKKGASYVALRRATSLDSVNVIRLRSSLSFLSDMIRERVVRRDGGDSVIGQLFVGLFGPYALQIGFARQVCKWCAVVPPHAISQNQSLALGKNLGSLYSLVMGVAAGIFLFVFSAWAYLVIMGGAAIFLFRLREFSIRLTLWCELGCLLGVSEAEMLKYLGVPGWVISRYRNSAMHRSSAQGG